MGCTRTTCIVPAVVGGAMLVVAVSASAAPNHTPAESTRIACHDIIVEATQRLSADVEAHLDRCLRHGVDCLITAADPVGCCARVAARCDDDRDTIAASEREFEALVTRRACTRVPFAVLLAPDGLGYGAVADRCACATPPAHATSLAELATCLRALVEDDVMARVASITVPRGREALVCLGLDAAFPAALAEPCDPCAPSGSPTPTPETTPTAATATAAASAPPTSAVTPTSQATPTSPATPTSHASATIAATPSLAASASPTPTIASATATAAVTATVLPTPTVGATASATAIGTVQPSFTPLVLPSPTNAPTAVPTPVSVCGNGILEGDEQCDGNVIDNTQCDEDVCTCDDFCDGPGGILSCNPDCTVNFSNCTAGGCEF